jgi:hypothetical protein
MTVIPDLAKHPQGWKQIELGVKRKEQWAEIQSTKSLRRKA